MIFIPYTYLIGWSQLNKWYYGVEYKNSKCGIANPSNLWTCYFTSSKHIKYFRRNYGEPDIIQVRKIFLCPSLARKWETKVLKRLKAVKSNKWLNKCDLETFDHKGSKFINNSVVQKRLKPYQDIPRGFVLGGLPKSEQTRINMSGKARSEETKRRISIGNRGKINSEQTRAKMVLAHLGKARSEETKRKLSIAMTGLIRSEETKRKISIVKSKEFSFISPEGIIFTGKNVTKFAKEHNLNSSHLIGVLNGKNLAHKGWKNLRTKDEHSEHSTS